MHHVCPELADNVTLFEYYMKMCDVDVVPIYVYISPKELDKTKCKNQMRKHSHNNTMFAVVPKGSDTSREVEMAAVIS